MTEEETARSQQSEDCLSLLNMVSATTTQQSNCRLCFCPTEVKAMLLDLPNFKDMVLTISECMLCGDKTRAIKTGSEISPKGKKITLAVKSLLDLELEIIKSETCSITVPEIDLELTRGTLGTQFTTIQGLLNMVLNDLQRHVTSISSDSNHSEESQNSALADFLIKLERLAKGMDNFTLIVDDPLSNSFIQQKEYSDLVQEDYERSEELNQELGLSFNHLLSQSEEQAQA